MGLSEDNSGLGQKLIQTIEDDWLDPEIQLVVRKIQGCLHIGAQGN